MKHGTTEFGNTSIDFTVTRSEKRSTIAVTVKPDGSVQAAVPKGTPKQTVSGAVRSKAAWIIRQQEFFRRQSTAYSKSFVSGESFPYLGRQYKLKVRRRSGIKRVLIGLAKGQFQVTVSSGLTAYEQSALVQKEMIQWYRLRAKQVIAPLARTFAAKIGVDVANVGVRDMKRRWGSGSSRQLVFNWRIIMAPRRLIEYVVAHELCHIVHPDHSRDFWRLLEQVMPDYERRRQVLAVQGPKFDLRRSNVGR